MVYVKHAHPDSEKTRLDPWLGHLPSSPTLDQVFKNESHTLEGAVDQLRWLASDLIANLGSDPAATMTMQ